MADYEQTTKTNPRRPDCVTKIRMGNSVLGFRQDLCAKLFEGSG